MAEKVKEESDQLQVIVDSLNNMQSGELQITVQEGKIVKIIRIENW
ncbi:DUF2292 domain-containing protein [Lederbergia wuyishanensis]|uniref:DUF2292 domain-containing protein n=1 Tax=Lederbergia wuyishanensis TaxID=1347903 RepID=A0ABU0D3Z5_9BACI|nr:DUF2292 domain-containing protein [Lederbergia wuyishanensis]MCJ8008274.1 DUF2292 domain-containing protein [Lederbergia wuyishanensis]MDQ0343135.1 hypothetical protein [Lederbergia wuyishanensis]